MASRGVASAAAIAALSVWTTASAAASAPADPFPKVAAAAYVVALDGEILWGRNLDGARAPASLTKLMTALVALESGWDPAALVTASARAAGASGARLGLRAGERIAAGDLLTAALVRSANDAAVALAEQSAGSVERFVERMNRRATALGLAATRFRNPSGLDEEGHRSTARDLLALARVAMAEPQIARRVGWKRAEVATVAGRVLSFDSGNQLLGTLAGVDGIKSGFTARAGKCVAARAVREGRTVWLVLLGAPDRWWTAAALIEEAFDAAARPR